MLRRLGMLGLAQAEFCLKAKCMWCFHRTPPEEIAHCPSSVFFTDCDGLLFSEAKDSSPQAFQCTEEHRAILRYWWSLAPYYAPRHGRAFPYLVSPLH